MPPARAPPFRQGDLDALCGLYAVINAIRLALGPDQSLLGDNDWQALFIRLLSEADRRIGGGRAVTDGIDTKPLWKVIGAARRHLAKRHGITLIAERPFRGRDRVGFGALFKCLATALEEPSSAIIVGLVDPFDHWTTVHRLTADYLCFYDSAGITRITLDRCRREQIIDGPSLLRFRLAPGPA